MDFASRDRYRQAVEELAEPTGDGQVRVALKSVDRARQIAERTPGEREAHIGYYLIGAGRRQFERGIGWKPRVAVRLKRAFFRHATTGYLCAIGLSTAALVAAAVTHARALGSPWTALVVVVLLTLVPASELAIQIVQRLIARLVPPRRLPRLDLVRVPETARTMVIIPTILDSVERARELAEHVEVQALGNLDPNIHFAILSDFRDADAERLPHDDDVLAPAAGRVTEGFGILQPRVSVTFTSAAGSLFARLYSGHTGVDPYTTAVSDTYQDLFGEGIFTGKGLYDVDAFIASLEDAVPENALLSHDLFEGLHARAALVSDVELVDEYPSTVLAHARRQHRWIRGDWQILLWLFPFVPTRSGMKRNSFPLISRWKILDNLRRSLVAPMLLALLVAGWTILPGAHSFWTALVLAVMASQLLPLVAQMLVGPRKAQSLAVFWRNLRADTAISLAQVLLSVTFLAYHAWDTAHAIVLTLVRLTMTQRRLLESG